MSRAASLRAQFSGRLIAAIKSCLPAKADPPPGPALPDGVTVVIPSRSGADLLARLLPGVERELTGVAHEVIVVDNGSDDGTATFLRERFPNVRVDLSAGALPFAVAVNRGIRAARFRYVCLLNNDMVVQEGFFASLLEAFAEVPDLFCATAQIFFPPGVRREETGKAVMPPPSAGWDVDSFPVRCDTPVEGENLSYVLYGSGGASAYDTVKLRHLGLFGEMFRPAYVEDLDVGFRGWQRGWPTVYVARASVIHYHRTTTSKFYTPEALELVLDVNYLRFLARAVVEPEVFQALWNRYTGTLTRRASRGSAPAVAALAFAARAARWIERPPRLKMREAEILAVGSGDVAVFPGRKRRVGPVVLTVMPSPVPVDGDVLVAYADALEQPGPELLAGFAEIVLVRRSGGPLALRGALRLAVAKHSPRSVRLEAAEMAEFVDVCGGVPVSVLERKS